MRARYHNNSRLVSHDPRTWRGSIHDEFGQLWDCGIASEGLDHPECSQPSYGMTRQDPRDRRFADTGLARQDALIPTSHVDLMPELS
jgi:hypothetical protein